MKLACVMSLLFSGSVFAANVLTRVACPDQLSEVDHVTYLFEPPPEFDPNSATQVEEALEGLTIFKNGETPIIIYPAKFRDSVFRRRLDAKIQRLREQDALRFAPVLISVEISPKPKR